jgi:hypothetical protein
MNRFMMTGRFIYLLAFLLLIGCGGKKGALPRGDVRAPGIVLKTNLPSEVRAFIRQREQFSLAFAKALGVTPDRPTLEFFAHARKGDLEAASRLFHDLGERGRIDTNLTRNLWEPLVEAQLVLESQLHGGGQYAVDIGKDIARSIPEGAIFFGGNRPGRGLAAAYATPTNGECPFMILSQNAFSDRRHLAYLRFAYGTKAYMPADQDAQTSLETYLEDARRRCLHDIESPAEPRQLKPGEEVKIVDGKAQVAGHVAVMAINGLIARTVFDRNPDREFYVMESFPLDWMFPHLSPHGLILKLNREPVATLTPEMGDRDRSYWNARMKRWIGGWLTPETPVKEVCAFAETIFLRKDYAGFEGDADFVRNDYITEIYAKLRSSQAGVYQWRIEHSRSSEEKQRMMQEADFAFRQAFVLRPTYTEVMFRYVALLVEMSRVDDALLVARTFGKLDGSNPQIGNLIRELEVLPHGHKTAE